MENKAEKRVVEEVSNMDSMYLNCHVGTPLKKALAEIVQKQPSDPIEYLSCWLFKYKEYQRELEREKEKIKEMTEAEIRRINKIACIEEEKRLVIKKRKEIIEERLRDKHKQEEVKKRQHEMEEARKQNLQSPERKDEKGQTALHRIAAQLVGDLSLLEKVPLLLAERDIEFRTPRDVAKQMGNEANVTEIDKYVYTLLERGDISVLKYLLLNSYEHFQPALDFKSETIQLPDSSNMFVNSISDTQEKITYLFSLIQEGDDEATERLLESQPQLASCKNNRGHSLLHVAILFENVSAVKQILDMNPDGINITDNLNRTPLHYAFAMSETITDSLLEAKAMDSLLDLMNKCPADYKEDPSEIRKLKEIYHISSPTAEQDLSSEQPEQELSEQPVPVVNVEETIQEEEADTEVLPPSENIES